MQLRYGVTIVDYESHDEAERLVRQFQETAIKPSWISMVISGPLQEEPLKKSGSQVPTYISTPGFNTGYGTGHNLAVEQIATHDDLDSVEWILLINPDIQISDTDRFIRDAWSSLSGYSEPGSIGAFSPVITHADGSVWYAGATLDRQRAGFPGHVGDAPRGGERMSLTDYACGAAMFVRSEAYLSGGGLPEHYFLYFEETDFCTRLRAQGYNIGVAAAASVVHERAWVVPPAHYLYYFIRNYHLFAYTFNTGALADVKAALAPWISSQRRRVLSRRPGAKAAFDETVNEAMQHGALLVSGRTFEARNRW